jgi:hypothetical protein
VGSRKDWTAGEAFWRVHDEGGGLALRFKVVSGEFVEEAGRVGEVGVGWRGW